MATSPFGNYADISQYQKEIAARRAATVSPLDALIQGAEQGLALQQAPQVLQNQQLAAQIALQLQRQKLNELQNPELALQRELQKAAIEGIVSGRNPSLIFQPQVSPEQAAMRQIALDQAGVPPPVSDFQQLVPAIGGMGAIGISPSAGIAAEQRKAAAKLASDEAKYKAAGIPYARVPNAEGGFDLYPTRGFGGEAPVAAPLSREGGEPVKAPVKTSSIKSLTPNAQNILFGQAGAAGVDPNDPKYKNEDGSYDFLQLSIDKGMAIRENKRVENALKAQGLTGKTKQDVDKLNAASKQLDNLQTELENLAKSGKAPGFADTFIAATTAAPPDGPISTLYQMGAKYFQSNESKDLEGRKGIVSSALTSAISGLAVSKSEAERLGWLPRPVDSFADLIRKVSLVEEYINSQRSGLSEGSAASPAPTTPPASGLPKVIRITPRAAP